MEKKPSQRKVSGSVGELEKRLSRLEKQKLIFRLIFRLSRPFLPVRHYARVAISVSGNWLIDTRNLTLFFFLKLDTGTQTHTGKKIIAG